MSDLYIKVLNGKPELQPYTKEEVRNIIYETSNMLLPATLNDKLLATFNYYPVEIIYIDNLSKKERKYAVNELKHIYNRNDTWYVEMFQVFNPHLLQQDWDVIKKERNRLLLESDWVQMSDVVSELTKKQYAAYRELLRDIIRVAEYPSDVVFPVAPSIEYNYDIENKKIKEKRALLSLEDKYTIENFNANKSETITNWNIFLKEWAKLNFTLDTLIVQNLILAYTNTTLDDILNS